MIKKGLYFLVMEKNTVPPSTKTAKAISSTVETTAVNATTHTETATSEEQTQAATQTEKTMADGAGTETKDPKQPEVVTKTEEEKSGSDSTHSESKFSPPVVLESPDTSSKPVSRSFRWKHLQGGMHIVELDVDLTHHAPLVFEETDEYLPWINYLLAHPDVEEVINL